MKRHAVVLLAVAVAASAMLACGRGEAKRKGTIGLSVLTLNQSIFQGDRRHDDRRGREIWL